jgi:hypothetical protein
MEKKAIISDGLSSVAPLFGLELKIMVLIQ